MHGELSGLVPVWRLSLNKEWAICCHLISILTYCSTVAEAAADTLKDEQVTRRREGTEKSEWDSEETKKGVGLMKTSESKREEEW